MRKTKFYRALFILLGLMALVLLLWHRRPLISEVQAENTGVSGLWVLANISYAGMRAQNNRDKFWRTLAFIFGLPGTLLTFVFVDEGGDRAYGIHLPPKSG
jgi:peptidoglycan/LPS O-acetylase OafA/YrhL